MRPLLIRTKIRPFESLISLVYRLIQDNFYEYPGRIYSLIAPHRKFECHNRIIDRDVTRKLSILNKCSEEEIISTTVHRFANFFSDLDIGFLDSISLRNFVLYSRTKYCPLCIKEFGYHKIYWDLLPVTICTKHEVILQNTCPKCNRPVTPYLVLRNKCKCGGELLSINPISIASYPEVINSQYFIQNLLEIRESNYSKAVYKNNDSPSTELSAPDFFKLLQIFTVILNKLPRNSTFFRLGTIMAEPHDWVIRKISTSNFTNFLLFHSAISIMLNWPHKFYQFLDEYRKKERVYNNATGMEMGFLNYLLLKELSPIKFSFIYSAYGNYFNKYWTNYHLPHKINYPDIELQKKIITIDEAAKILGIAHEKIPRLINHKIIHTVNLKSYLFRWDEIPENDSEKLMNFLRQNYSIDWVKTAKTAKIEKIDDKTIRISAEKNFLLLSLNNEETKVSLIIDDGRTDELIAIMMNDNLKIFLKSKNQKRYLIYAESVYLLKKQMDKMLLRQCLADRLDITYITLRSLVLRGLLAPPKKSRGPYKTFFELEEVEKFEKEFISQEKFALVDKKPKGYLSTSETVKRYRYNDVDIAGLLCLVREGVFNPILCKEGKGLSRLLFGENELKKHFINIPVEKEDKNKLSLHKVGVIIGLDKLLVPNFINIGLVTTPGS